MLILIIEMLASFIALSLALFVPGSLFVTAVVQLYSSPGFPFKLIPAGQVLAVLGPKNVALALLIYESLLLPIPAVGSTVPEIIVLPGAPPPTASTVIVFPVNVIPVDNVRTLIPPLASVPNILPVPDN